MDRLKCQPLLDGHNVCKAFISTSSKRRLHHTELRTDYDKRINLPSYSEFIMLIAETQCRK